MALRLELHLPPMSTDTSPGGILKVALPIIVSSLSIHLIGLVDTLFLSRLGTVELGAAGNANLLYFTIVMSGSGLCLGAQIIMGRRNGEGNFHRIGTVFHHAAVIIAVLAVLFMTALYFLTGPVTSAVNISQAIAESTDRYMRIRLWGLPLALGNFLFIAFYVGITKTKVLAIATPLMAGTNILLDYLFIFGHGGFQPMGLEGAAYASVIAEGVGLLVFVGNSLLNVPRAKYNLFKVRSWEGEVFGRIWKIGSPLMIQNFIGVASWFIFFTLIEQLGEKPLAVSHIARAIYMMMVIPINGLGDAVNTLVSNAIGEERGKEVHRILRRAVLMCLVFDVFYFLALRIYGTEIAALFSTDGLVVRMTEQVLDVIAVAVFFFSTAFIAYRALAGTGSTALSMRIEIFTVALYLAAAFALVIYFRPSVEQVWYLEFLYFTSMGLLSYFFLKKEKWHAIRV